MGVHQSKYSKNWEKYCLETVPQLEKTDSTKFDLKDIHLLAKVLDVYDGDTITVAIVFMGELKQVRVRMFGINAPERRPPKSLKDRDEIKKAAMASTIYLRQQISGKNVHLHCHGIDSFGRILATVYLDSVDICEKMISGGYAVKYTK